MKGAKAAARQRDYAQEALRRARVCAGAGCPECNRLLSRYARLHPEQTKAALWQAARSQRFA